MDGEWKAPRDGGSQARGKLGREVLAQDRGIRWYQLGPLTRRPVLSRGWREELFLPPSLGGWMKARGSSLVPPTLLPMQPTLSPVSFVRDKTSPYPSILSVRALISAPMEFSIRSFTSVHFLSLSVSLFLSPSMDRATSPVLPRFHTLLPSFYTGARARGEPTLRENIEIFARMKTVCLQIVIVIHR